MEIQVMKDWYLRTPAALFKYTLKFRTFILLQHDGCLMWNRNCLPFRNTCVDSLVYCAVFCRLLYWLLLWCLQTLLREYNPTYIFFEQITRRLRVSWLEFQILIYRICQIHFMLNSFLIFHYIVCFQMISIY